MGKAGQEADGGEVGGGGGGVELREMGLRVGRGRLRSSEVAVCGGPAVWRGGGVPSGEGYFFGLKWFI